LDYKNTGYLTSSLHDALQIFIAQR